MEKKRSLVFFGILILVSTIGITAWSSTTFAEEVFLPNWVRDTALWWGEGKISDGDFINALQYLMNEKILKVPSPDVNTEEIIDKEINFDKLSLEVTGIEELIRVYDLRQYLRDSNQEFQDMQDVYSVIDQRETEWIDADSEVITPFMMELIDNEISDQFRIHAFTYKESFGYEMYPEIFMTNSFGVNIAQTGKTSDYVQNDELWWIRANQDGVYISEVHYDESANVYSADIVLRINDNQGEFLGVIKAVTNVEQIYEP